MPSATHTETVTIPVEAVIEAAAQIQSISEVAVWINHQISPVKLTEPFDEAADDLLRLAFPSEQHLDIDDSPAWSAFMARASELAADRLEAVVDEYPWIASRLLGVAEYDVEKLREQARRYGAESEADDGD